MDRKFKMYKKNSLKEKITITLLIISLVLYLFLSFVIMSGEFIWKIPEEILTRGRGFLFGFNSYFIITQSFNRLVEVFKD